MNREEALKLLEEFHTPTHVREHCKKVAAVGEYLAQKMKACGIEVDPDVVWIAGMIHDVVRVVDFKTLDPTLGSGDDQKIWMTLREKHHGKHHADVIAEILKERGEIKLSEIVKTHRYLAITSENPPKTWEAKLLYYSDKRVSHDQIVSLQERLDEGNRRNHPKLTINDEESARREAIVVLEESIFENLEIRPSDLQKLN